MTKHVNITLTGKVQNVGFRFSAIQLALELGITGMVKNLGQNQVYLEIEGEEEKLKLFMRWCKTGPQGARVEQFDYVLGEVQGYTEFKGDW